MTQRALWVACLLTALTVGCGTKGSGTFVVLDFSATGAAPRTVHTIDVDLSLDGRSGHAHYAGKSSGDIALPTDGTLELGTLGGVLDVTALARDAGGAVVAMATAHAVLAAQSTSHLAVIFGGSNDGGTGGDAGADARDGASDGGTGGAATGGSAGQGGRGQGGAAGSATGGASTGGSFFGGSGPGGSTASGGQGQGGAGPGGAGGQGTASLVVDRTTVDFGAVMVSSSSPPVTLTFLNNGTVPLGGLMVVSSDPSHFGMITETCTQAALAPGARCTVTLRFSPTVTGLATGTLGVGTGPSFHTDVMLSGSGYAPNTPAKIVITPSHDFGLVDVGSRASFALVVANSGGTASSVLSLSALAGPWSIGQDSCSGKALAAAEQCTVNVTFVPSGPGDSTATLMASASTGGSASSVLTGTGRATVSLAITLVGGGVVSGSGLTCANGACTGSYTYTDPNRLPTVQLNAMPDAYSVFGGWSGSGVCGASTACTLSFGTDTKLTATFNARNVVVNLNVVSIGGHTGIVTSGDGKLACKDNCPGLSHAAGPSFALVAEPSSVGSTFAAWNGAFLMVNGAPPCRGTSPKCVFDLTGDVTITAVFAPQAYMFVTSTSPIPGLLGGVAGADDECNQRAKAAGLPGTYSAWLSGKGFSANQRVGKGGWIRTDGRVFASSLSALTSSGNFQSFYPPRVDENGNDLGPTMIPVATGGNQDGSSFGVAQCGDYGSASGDLYVGTAAAGAGYWAYNFLDSGGCSQPHRLYCFRNDLSAEIKPPAIPGRRIFVSRTQFTAASGVAVADTICKSEAKGAGLPGYASFIALVSTSAASAGSRLNFNGAPWKRPDDVQVALSPQDFGRGQLLAPIDVTADGASHVNRGVWTGSTDLAATSGSGQSCKDWGDATKNASGLYGYPNQGTTGAWWSSGSATCDTVNFYALCIEP